VRPDAVRVAASWFQKFFKGDALYALKANPSPWVIRELAACGVAGFDVASIREIELARGDAPGARGAGMETLLY
jgi:ornithine decarboxylase